jgi:hypothetical protein
MGSGGKDGGGSAPEFPDPSKYLQNMKNDYPDINALSEKQYQYNKKAAEDTAALNRVNQQNPWGSITWNKGPDGNWQSQTTLSPSQQSLFDSQTNLQLQNLGLQSANLARNARIGNVADAQVGRVSDALTRGLSDLPRLDTDFTGAAQRAQDAILGRLQPQMDQERAALETKLANQGITLGSEAWRNAMDDRSRATNDLRLGAVQAGNQEAQRLFSDAFQARQQGVAEHALPMQDLAALQSMGAGLPLGPAVSMPQFSAVPQVGLNAPDYMGATTAQQQMASQQAMQMAMAQYQGAMQAMTSQQQSSAGKMGGVGQLAGTLGSAAILA